MGDERGGRRGGVSTMPPLLVQLFCFVIPCSCDVPVGNICC